MFWLAWCVTVSHDVPASPNSLGVYTWCGILGSKVDLKVCENMWKPRFHVAESCSLIAYVLARSVVGISPQFRLQPKWEHCNSLVLDLRSHYHSLHSWTRVEYFFTSVLAACWDCCIIHRSVCLNGYVVTVWYLNASSIGCQQTPTVCQLRSVSATNSVL